MNKTMIAAGDTPKWVLDKANEYTNKLVAEHDKCYGPVTAVNAAINVENRTFHYRCTIYMGVRVCEHKAIFS